MSSLDLEPDMRHPVPDEDGTLPFHVWAEQQRRAMAERKARTLADVELAYAREAIRLEAALAQVEKDLLAGRFPVQ